MNAAGRGLSRLARLTGLHGGGVGCNLVTMGGGTAATVGVGAMSTLERHYSLLLTPPASTGRSAWWVGGSASAHSSAAFGSGRGTRASRSRGEGGARPRRGGRGVETGGQRGDDGKSSAGAGVRKEAAAWQHGRKSYRHLDAVKLQHVTLNKRLMAARDLSTLMAVAEADGLTALGPLNVDTLLARLLGLHAYQNRDGVVGAKGGRVRALLMRVCDYMASGLPGFPTVTLTNCLERLVRLQLRHVPIELQKGVERELVRRPREFATLELVRLCRLGAGACGVTHLLPAFLEMERRIGTASLPLDSLLAVTNAFAAVSYHSPAVLDALERRLTRDLLSLDGPLLAAAISELAAFPDHSPELVDDLATQVATRTEELKPAHLADAAHAVSLARRPAPEMLDAIQRRMTPPRLYALGPERLTRLSCALALSGRLSEDMAATIERCAVKRLYQFGGADLGRLLWSVGLSRGAHAHSLFGEVESRLVETMDDMDPNTLAGAAWACVQSGYRSLAVVDAFDARAATLHDELDPDAHASVELASIVQSLQAMAGDENAERLRVLQRTARSPLKTAVIG